MSNRAFSKKTLTLLLTVFILQIFFIFSFPAASFARGEEGLSKPKLKLNVPIPGTAYDKPGKEYSIDIADYIGVIYQYSLSIVTIIAVLMIMIAGVTWLMAGGSPEKVTTAKNMIGGAVIGLLLMLFSYLLLNTINPRLTKLEVPEIRKIKEIANSICCENDKGKVEQIYGANNCPDKKKKVALKKCGIETVGVGDICFTISDKEKCEASCEGCECHPMYEDAFTKMANWVAYATGAAVTGGLAPEAAVKTAQLAWKGAKITAKILFKGKRALVTIPGGIGAIVAGSGDKGERGLCYAEAKDLPKGAVCGENKNCRSNICITATSYPVGVCSDGSVGSACKTDSDCVVENHASSSNKCVKTSSIGGTDIKFCTDGKAGSPCEDVDDCDGSFNCQNSRCIDLGGNPVGSSCVGDSECLTKICVNNKCSSGEANSWCYNNDDCVSAGGCVNNICRP